MSSLKTLCLLPLMVMACADQPVAIETADPTTGVAERTDLPIGAVEEMKADGDWGHATTCKSIPELEPLNDPAIVISLNGLTLRLYDRAGSYDRTFPIGVGAKEDGVSLTPDSLFRPDALFHTRSDAAPVIDGPTPDQARWGWNHQCRMWWTDEEGDKVPVFAGLPFIRLEGPRSNAYGIHGPIDKFTRPNGGSLRRGYVSHGCIRMEAADVVEVYALIQGHRAPVRVQQAIERLDGKAVDTPQRWINSECSQDADCNFEGGFCKQNPYSGRGFCTARCERFCLDKDGHPTTFCVDDPDEPDLGMCVNRAIDWAGGCSRYDHFTRVRAPRHGQPWSKNDVCLPGSPGWIGDGCLADDDCMGQRCVPRAEGPGICTERCQRYCPDLDGGYATTFCVGASEASELGGGMCVSRCSSNDECGVGTTCEEEPRFGQSQVTRKVCLPY